MQFDIQIPMLSREVITEALKGAPETAKQQREQDNQVERRYERMLESRQPFLDEARTMAVATIPFLYTQPGTANIFNVQRTNQSLVSKGIINLAKELGSTIFPPNARFFQHKIQPNLAKEIEQSIQQLKQSQQQQPSQQQQGDTVDPSEVAGVLENVNNKIMQRDDTIRDAIKGSPDSENFYQGMIHAQIAGQFCFFKPNLETSKIYTLENFVAEFDSTGEVVEVVVRDVIHFSRFTPEQLRDLFQEDNPEYFEAANLENIVVFTRQVRRWDHWEIQVEIAGKRYAPMEGHEDLDAPPFIVVPFFLFPGQKYAVGWCSYNSGDIIQFENMSLSINELSKAACKVVAMIPPEVRVTEDELSKGGMSFVFSGGSAPIQMIYADISKNLQAVTGVYEMVRAALLSIFLLDEAVRRDAERVTKEEIQTLSNGLKKLLGGLYLSLARRWQFPYINRVNRLMEKEGKIQKVDPSQVQMILTAGLETLEQEEELQNLDQLVARIGQLGPEGLQRLNRDELFARWANNLSVVSDKLLMTGDQAQEEAGVSQLVEMAKQFGPQGPQMLAQFAQQMMEQMQKGGGVGQQTQQQEPATTTSTPYEQAMPQGGGPPPPQL